MTCRVVWGAEARTELSAAVAWYEEREPGLGIRFVHQLDAIMEAIARNPWHFAPASPRTRKARVRGWPYRVYFSVDDSNSVISVVAVWHTARNPELLKRRIHRTAPDFPPETPE